MGVTAILNSIRRLREEKGLTQEQLARKLGVSRQTVNSLEAGRYKPSIVLALKIAGVYGLPVEQVFTLEPGDWD